MIRLSGDARLVSIAPGYQLHAPGLIGQAELVSVRDRAKRCDGGIYEAGLLQASDAAEITTEMAFEIEVQEDRYRAPSDVTRGRIDRYDTGRRAGNPVSDASIGRQCRLRGPLQ